jgi:hypothetical protein
MPIFRYTVKNTGNSNTIRYEKGMTVDVVTQTTSNPLFNNGGQSVADAFMRIYGIDLKKAGILSSAFLDYKIV